MSALIGIGYIAAIVALASASLFIGVGIRVIYSAGYRGGLLNVLSCWAGIVGALWIALIYFAPFTVTL